MSLAILEMTPNDLHVFTNKVLKLNDGLVVSKELYKVELLEQVGNTLKVCYLHDYVKNGKAKLDHLTEEIKLDVIYKKIENELRTQNHFELKTKEIDNIEEDSINYLVDVMVDDDLIYFQIEDTKLQSYIRIYNWATN